MNLEKLKIAESRFMEKFPGGFAHPDLVAIGKKHRMEKHVEFAQTHFGQTHFLQPQDVLENLVRAIGRSSLISVFEKPRLRDWALDGNGDSMALVEGLFEMLHGDQKAGFEEMTETLKPAKLAKWSLLTVIPNYYSPLREVFIKPTTAKGVLKHFDIVGLEYKPLPTWDFYTRYRDLIQEMKSRVHPSLAPSNAAFGGFLRITLQGL